VSCAGGAIFAPSILAPAIGAADATETPASKAAAASAIEVCVFIGDLHFSVE
jgi:hypothetical protein